MIVIMEMSSGKASSEALPSEHETARCAPRAVELQLALTPAVGAEHAIFGTSPAMLAGMPLSFSCPAGRCPDPHPAFLKTKK